MSVKKASAILLVVVSFFFVNTVYAINDITIDGVLGDWDDENGFYLDTYGDATPARTDITQYGLAVVDNGPSPESLSLVMVTDDYQDTGNPTGDSHPMVFYVGPYEIVVQLQNGCDAVNWVEIDSTPTTAYTAVAVGLIDPPVYAPPPENDTTIDCAMEIEFPISALPLLDSDSDGELLDESFPTNFATRQSGGVGNDNDMGDHGVSPTAITLKDIRARTNTGSYVVPLFMVGSVFGMFVTVFHRQRKRARRS